MWVKDNDEEATTASQLKSSDDDLFYYYEGKKIFIKQNKDQILLKFSSNADKVQLRNIIESDASLKSTSDTYLEESSLRYAVLAGKDSKNISLATIEFFKKKSEVVSAEYMFQYDGGKLQGITNEFIVKLKKSTSFSQLKELAEKYNCIVGEENEFVKNQFKLFVSKSVDINAMRMSNLFYETGLFEFSEPNAILFNAFDSNDTYFNNQWALKNTGQYSGTSGIDIKAEQAWTITSGNISIKIAICDSGVDLTHPDLQNNLLTGYDATGSNLGGAAGPIAHGTACAGIAAAIQNNNEGISGVAPNCIIIPVCIGRGNSISNDCAADGIQWAWQTAGVHVISCSWGGGSYYQQITDAINNAVLYGRKNKGCVVVFNSGNFDKSTVDYPASQANVIAVGAISQCGQRKSLTSCDGESWGSHYGSALDVVAPGVKIYTTDIQGSGGYNTSSGTTGDYIASFSGTSAACPHVAGIAALILSYDPNITGPQARAFIEASCTKLSGYTYSFDASHPYGTWTNEVGHGLVNAYAALGKVQGKYVVSFDLNGGTGVPPSTQIVSPGGKATLPSPAPTRSGHTFGGWYATAGCFGSAIDFTTYTINSDQTLYAKWVADPVVSFNLSGAPGSVQSQIVPIGGYASVPDPEPTWSPNYTFDGWYANSLFSGSPFDFSNTPIISNTTLYAKWTLTYISFGFNIIVQNYSSYDLSSLQIKMWGKVGSDANSTYFLNYSNSYLAAGSVTPTSAGPTFSLLPNKSISSMSADISAYCSSNVTLRVVLTVNSASTGVFSTNSGFQNIAYTPGSSTTSTNGTRTLTVVISNN